MNKVKLVLALGLLTMTAACSWHLNSVISKDPMRTVVIEK